MVYAFFLNGSINLRGAKKQKDKFRSNATHINCNQWWGFLRPAKICRSFILGLMCSAILSQSPRIWLNVQCTVYSVQCTVYSVQCILYSPQQWGGGMLASNRQNTGSPKYNDDISFLISQYLISDCDENMFTALFIWNAVYAGRRDQAKSSEEYEDNPRR